MCKLPPLGCTLHPGRRAAPWPAASAPAPAPGHLLWFGEFGGVITQYKDDFTPVPGSHFMKVRHVRGCQLAVRVITRACHLMMQMALPNAPNPMQATECQRVQALAYCALRVGWPACVQVPEVPSAVPPSCCCCSGRGPPCPHVPLHRRRCVHVRVCACMRAWVGGGGGTRNTDKGGQGRQKGDAQRARREVGHTTVVVVS